VLPAQSPVDTETQAPPALHITYYTDPLCSWSWAFEPQWRRLRYEFGAQIGWRYRMGGLLPDWQKFDDPLNAVSRPAQMGPYWLQVQHLSGMPLDELIWVEDPPASSYPACLAFKAAELQSTAIAEQYLRRLREGVMLERRNIARWDVLVELAHDVPGMDAVRLLADLQDTPATEAFREDLKDVSYREIGRFPTLILRVPDGRATIIVGHRPFDALREAVAYIAPGLQPERTSIDLVEYARHWGRLTFAEVAEAAEALRTDRAAAEAALERAAAAGELRKDLVGRHAVYTALSGPGVLPAN
jgi:putative protein-disulfide isomerase